MPEAYIDRGWAGQRDGQGLGHNLGRINHYAVRSLDSFLIKRDRGDVNPGRNHAKTQDGLAYWQIHDWNMIEDRRILRFNPAVQARIEELKQLPRVANLHEVGVQWHKRKAEELRLRADMAELRSRILEFTRVPRTVQPGWLLPEETG